MRRVGEGTRGRAASRIRERRQRKGRSDGGDIICGGGNQGASGGDGSEGGPKPVGIVRREAGSQGQGEGEAHLRGEVGKDKTGTG
jgi:hypothetical protein